MVAWPRDLEPPMAEALAPLPVSHGDVVGDKYRLLHQLGQGGMAVVMEAEHVQLRHHLALKFMRPEMCESAEAVARFLREGRAAAQIQSEHVAHVLDVGTVAGNVPYLAMELLSGCNLEQELSARGPLPVGETVDYLLQACEAIAEAHALGIVHRDLKPSNLFLARRRDGTPVVKVLDFGIAKAVDPTEPGSADLTATAAVLGSPQYLPPEQLLSSKTVDHRADIWGLGTVLYELLTGHPAFDAPTLALLATMIMRDPPVRPRTHRPELPRELEAIVLRCLDKDRDKRFQNVAELAEALVPFAPMQAATQASADRVGRLVTAVEPTTDELASPFTATEHVASSSMSVTQTIRSAIARWSTPRGAAMRARTRRSWLVAVGAGSTLAAGLAVGLAVLVWPSGPTRNDPPTPSPSGDAVSTDPPVGSGRTGDAVTTSAATTASLPGRGPEALASALPSAEPVARPVESGSTASSANALPLTDAGGSSTSKPKSLATAGKPTASASTPAPKPSSHAPKPNCTPNYWLDEQGNKHFKAECF